MLAPNQLIESTYIRAIQLCEKSLDKIQLSGESLIHLDYDNNVLTCEHK